VRSESLTLIEWFCSNLFCLNYGDKESLLVGFSGKVRRILERMGSMWTSQVGLFWVIHRIFTIKEKCCCSPVRFLVNGRKRKAPSRFFTFLTHVLRPGVTVYSFTEMARRERAVRWPQEMEGASLPQRLSS
jgi:hypothetical protein